MFNQRNGTFRLGMLIAVVAGLWTIVHLIWNVVGVKAEVPSGFLPGGKRLFLPPGEQAEKHWQDLPLVR